AGVNMLLIPARPPVHPAPPPPLPQNPKIIPGPKHPPSSDTPASLPPPAPESPYGATLGVFTNLVNPNGDWKLYVADVGSATKGAIDGGWQLGIQTAPSIQPIQDQATLENVVGKVTIVTGDNQPGVNLQVGASGDPSLFQP